MKIVSEISVGISLDLSLVVDFRSVSESIKRVRERHLEFDEKGLLNYLGNVNDILNSRRAPSGLEEMLEGENLRLRMREHYVVASCVYLFAQPLLDFEIPSKTRNRFNTLIRQKYRVIDPFNLYLKRAEDSDELLDEEEAREIKKFINPANEHLKQGFSGSRNAITVLFNELTYWAGELQAKNYSEQNHFMFVGLYHVCLPLLGIKENDPRFTRFTIVDRWIKDHFGEFVFQLPEYFEER